VTPPARPAWVYRTVLALLLRDDVGRDIAADLSEEFDDVVARDGIRAARRWYARQVRRSIGARAAAAVVGSAEGLTSAAALGRQLRFGGELRATGRAIRRAPWYAASVVTVVALAMSLATTVFATVDGVLFKPLPFGDATQLVGVELGFSREGVYGGRVLPEDLDAWQALMPDVALSAVRVIAETHFERVNEGSLGIAHIRSNLLEVIGVRPWLGGFTQDDLRMLDAERPSPRPVLVSYQFWQTRLGGDRGAIGRILAPEHPSYAPIRIAGVMPSDFAIPGLRDAHLIIPSSDHARSLRDTMVLARVPRGMSHEAFATRLESALRITSAVTDGRGGARPDRVTVRPLAEALQAGVGPLFRALFAAGIVLVLIGCLNVSGLMTARCVDRAREIGLRRAIGARPGDVVRMLMVEQGMLCGAGTVIGVVLAAPLLRVALSLLPPEIHLLKTPSIDGRVIVFALAAMVVSLVVASIWPLRRALTAEVQKAITHGGGGTVTSRTTSLVSRALTVGQVMGAVVLVVAGGLFVGSLLRVQSNELGYDAERVVVAEIGVASWLADPALDRDWEALRVSTSTNVAAFLEQIRAMPGVLAAGAIDVAVLVGSQSYSSRFNVVGVDRPAGHGGPGSFMVGDAAGGLKVPVTPGFFTAAGVRLLEGRLPTDEELRVGAPVAAVSRTYARENLGSASAVGRYLEHIPTQRELPQLEIVGVVEDPRLMRWDSPASSAVFAPYSLFGGAIDPVLFVRGVSGGRALTSDVLRLAESGRPVIRPVRVQPASAMLGDSIRIRRLQSWLFGAFAASGLALAGIGLLGFVAMTTARRSREVGIRMALGATRGTVVGGLISEQAMPVAFGLVGGAGAAAWVVRLLEAYVYQISAHDVRIWVMAIVLVALTSTAGVLIPSWRASRIDPVRALRVE
jgi:predicted permease